MDPITIIVTALAVGAAAGLKPTAELAVKDAYSTLKELIKQKYGIVNIALLEEHPESEVRQAVVKEDLEKTAANEDVEILKHSQKVLEAAKSYAQDSLEKVGVSLQDIQAASLTIENIINFDRGVDVTGAHISGDITIKNVRSSDEKGGDSKNV